MIMHDMNNNNSNKYYFKQYHPMANNQHHRPHHPGNMFEAPRNDYFNGPPTYMGPIMNNNNMMTSGGYNHFSNSYPSGGGNGGGGPFYRDFRQNWQPQQMISQPQSTPQRQLVPPPTNATISQGQSCSSSSLSTSTLTTTSSSTSASSSANLVNRSSTTTTISITPSSTSSSSTLRNLRTTDEHTLVKLKQHLAVTQKELLRVTAEKMKLQVEETRLQKIVDKTKLEVDRLESRTRDPRVKNRPDGLSDSSTSSPLDRSISSNFNSTSVPSLTPLATTMSNPIITPVPNVNVQNNTNNSMNSDADAFAALFGPPPMIGNHHIQHSTPTTLSVSNSMLMAPLTSISVPNTNNSSNNTSNGSLFGSTSLLAPTNKKQNPSSRGKQLNNLVQFKGLPLVFDTFPEEILKPEIYTSNQTKIKVNFMFKSNQLELIQRNQQQRVLLRICYVKAKKSSQSDRVSRKLLIKINSRPFPLGKQTNGSIKAPLDITLYCTELRNDLELCWPENEPGRDYGVGIFINQRYSPDHSLATLKTKDYQRPSCEALKMIAKNFAASGDICSEEIMVPLCCPITKKRLEIPAIGIKCEHLACFDAKSFLDITSKRPEWHCPSCKKAIGFNDLRIDCLIVEILEKTPSDCYKVSFDRNGAWYPVIDNKEKESVPTLIDVNRIDIITLDDSDDENLKGDCDVPPSVTQGEARMELETEHEDEEEDEETEQEEDDEEDEEEDEDEDDDDDDDEEDEEEDSNEDTEEEGSRERRKKHFVEIFGSDSRENSPDSSVQSPATRRKRRHRDRPDKAGKTFSRKNRRRH